MTPVAFEIPGDPHAKKRPRFGNGRTYTPQETINAETFIRLTAAPMFAEPFDCAVALDITAIFAPPKSWSARKTAATLGAPHTQRPDLDNIVKTVADALNGVAYADDGQIAEAACRKVWGPVAKTVVVVRPIMRGLP